MLDADTWYCLGWVVVLLVSIALSGSEESVVVTVYCLVENSLGVLIGVAAQ